MGEAREDTEVLGLSTERVSVGLLVRHREGLAVREGKGL